MAWTTPRTWTDGELVTAAIMDVHVRDNFNAMGPHLIARKTSDQSVTSSTALVDDTALQLTVAANEVWLMHFHLRYQANGTADMKISFAFPAGGVIDAAASGSMANATTIFADQTWPNLTASDANPLPFSGGGSVSDTRTLLIDGTYIGAGTAGTVKLRWAQNTSDVTATKVLAQSTLWGCKLA